MIITICGSFKFKDKMIDIYKQLTEMGHLVFLPAIDCSKHRQEWYLRLHFEKIAMSDAVYVVDVDGYVGEATRSEMCYAEGIEKIILRYSNHDLGVA